MGRLREARRITVEQAAQFRAQGAIGSQQENWERNEGYKGFSQQGLSEVIAATDPRKNLAHAAPAVCPVRSNLGK